MTWLSILCLAYAQNIAFTMVLRSRNRDNMWYHAFCSVFSSGLWFVTMHQLVVNELTPVLLLPYVVGTVAGSVTGAKVSMYIEKAIGASV